MADPTFWSRMGFDGGSALGIAGVHDRFSGTVRVAPVSMSTIFS